MVGEVNLVVGGIVVSLLLIWLMMFEFCRIVTWVVELFEYYIEYYSVVRVSLKSEGAAALAEGSYLPPFSSMSCRASLSRISLHPADAMHAMLPYSIHRSCYL